MTPPAENTLAATSNEVTVPEPKPPEGTSIHVDKYKIDCPLPQDLTGFKLIFLEPTEGGLWPEKPITIINLEKQAVHKASKIVIKGPSGLKYDPDKNITWKTPHANMVMVGWIETNSPVEIIN